MVNGDVENLALGRAHKNYTPTHGRVDASCDILVKTWRLNLSYS